MTGWVLALAFLAPQALAQPVADVWEGEPIVPVRSLSGWELDGLPPGASGALSAAPDGHLRVSYDLGDGACVQARFVFSEPRDWSDSDIFGLRFRGSEGEPNTVTLMFADAHEVFYGVDLPEMSHVARAVGPLALPKALFRHYWGGDRESPTFDWTSVAKVFVTVKRASAETGGGSGTLDVLGLSRDRAADWERLPDGERPAANPRASASALAWLGARQTERGWVVSWLEEPQPKAFLYDQALALLAFSRGDPTRAERLARTIVEAQDGDAWWARCVDPRTGEVLSRDKWVGDQAWAAYALAVYARERDAAWAMDAARRSAEGLARRQRDDGSIAEAYSTEGQLDCWWAFMATGLTEEAGRLRDYILARLWNDDMGCFLRGYADGPDAVVACDCQTWGAEFARAIGRDDIARRCLGFAYWALRTTGGGVEGLDGMGPVSVWCEGTAQFISARGPEAGRLMEGLIALQSGDGGVPGSPESWSTGLVWLTTWRGTSSTAWFYFALTGSPLGAP